jgi:hypothetical protein
MDAASLAVIAQLISGPAAAVGICLVFLFGSYKLIVTKALPQFQKNLDQILEEHRKDREVFKESIDLMDKRLNKLEDEVREIKYLCKSKEH